MSEKKQLNEEQLAKVAGGGNYASDEHLPANHGVHVRADQLLSSKYKGKKFYCVLDSNDSVYAVVTFNNAYIDHYDILIENMTVLETHGNFNPVGCTRSVGTTFSVASRHVTMYLYN